ncbi:MAG: carboxypeptidase-like regulatory domain-containing protein [Prevotellaceae bacterium]|jgi:uncharacterized protein YfaS (alpha-2-macroglobulin family)|nr:carboxypeptidase-like regulatory domain-containing protein [Prevotellaceae bacterium]
MRHTILFLVIAFALGFTATAQNMQEMDYSGEWLKIDDLTNKQRLPKSALPEIKKVYDMALGQKNYVQVIKAIIYRMNCQKQMQQNTTVVILDSLLADAGRLPQPAKSVVYSIIADVYKSYYQDKRWQIQGRTRTAIVEDDINTWDISRLFEEAIKYYKLSIQDDKILQQTSIDNYNDILYYNYSKSATIPLLPTLYDFLVFRTIKAFESELAASLPQQSFVPDKPEYFADVRIFANYNINSADTLSAEYQVISLYQKLLKFRLQQPDNNISGSNSVNNLHALINIDIERLKYLRLNGKYSDNDAMYEKALKSLTDAYGNKPEWTYAAYALANLYKSQAAEWRNKKDDKLRWKYREANELCQQIITLFPDSKMASYAKDLQNEIKSPSVQLTMAGTQYPGCPVLALVKYRNLNKLYLFTYKVNEKFVEENRNINLSIFLKKTPVKTQEIDLPSQADYQSYSSEIGLEGLPQGNFVIFASNSPQLPKDDDDEYGKNPVARIMFQVSPLIVILRSVDDYAISTPVSAALLSKNNNKSQVYVTDSKSGETVKNAKIDYYTQRWESAKQKYVEVFDGSYYTDDEGIASIPIINDRGFKKAIITHKNNRLLLTNWNGGYWRRNRNENRNQVVFFTDRAIYRPGQTVFYKALYLKSNNDGNNQLVTKSKLQVEFKDVNYKTIDTQKQTTNEYGTIQGSFTIPQGLLNGYMTLQTEYGSIGIRVEEYKRPTFEVKFDPISKNYQLNDSVEISGLAKALAGYVVDNSKVQYRVVRTIQYKLHRWWFPPISQPQREIVSGEVTTDSKGAFKINFKAEANNIKNDDLIYEYTVTVDITDVNGETRSAVLSVKISKKPLLIVTSIPSHISDRENLKFDLSTTNLNGDLTPADVTVKITELKAPGRILRSRLWEVPDTFALSRSEFIANFPFDPYGDENNPEKYAEGKNIISFQTKTVGNVNELTGAGKENANKIDLKELVLGSGWYRIDIKAKNSEGIEVDDVKFVQLVGNAVISSGRNVKALQSGPAPIQTMSEWLTIIKNSGEPGKNAEFWIAGGEKKSFVRYEVLFKDNVVSQKTITVGTIPERISIPIKEEYRGGFAVQFTMVQNERTYTSLNEINVPYTNKQLDVIFSTFRDKLLPGEQEKWTLSVKNKQNEKEIAEMVATLYDASLDMFRPHSWDNYSRFYPQRSHYKFSWKIPEYSSATSTQYYGYREHKAEIPRILYPQLDKFNTYRPSLSQAEIKDGILISGKITDTDTGEPIVFASIEVKGTTIGTVSDMDGHYTIKAPKTATILVFSEVGHAELQVDINGRVRINVSLKPIDAKLNKIVVGSASGVAASKAVSNIRIRGISSISDSMEEEESEAIPFAEVLDERISAVSTGGGGARQAPLEDIATRQNFNETAFFYPQLRTNEDGEIIIEFTIPEALTRWKMLGFAHTKDFKTGSTTNELITQKQVAISANAPRFFRENDVIEFTAKVNNITEGDLNGQAMLRLYDAASMQPVDAQIMRTPQTRNFSIKAGESVGVKWTLAIPAGIQAITYKITAQVGAHTDGEEKIVPVMSNTMLITETMPFSIRAGQQKNFTFTRLKDNKSTTLRNYRLTLEFTSNPAWYAVQAMPYLMEYPYECSEQIFSRFYANSLATSIANNSPRVKQIFDMWRNLPENKNALLSNLEKNQELKQVLLEETPWVMQVENETERKKRVGLLFDLNRMSGELQRAFDKLKKAQTSNGGFPWFAGLPESRYITQHIIAGVEHLKKLNVLTDNFKNDANKMAANGLAYLDVSIKKDYDDLLKIKNVDLNKQQVDAIQLHYLYACSFSEHKPQNEEQLKAFDYYFNQASKYWVNFNIYNQAITALAMKRFGNHETASAIIKSLKERALQSEEMGMYWKDNVAGYFWYQAPIETQAVLIEAFNEAANDKQSVEEMKIWLLRNKQTNDWRTTKATTEAVYALLMTGNNLLDESKMLEIKISGKPLAEATKEEMHPEPGTGYVKTAWSGNDISRDMASLSVKNLNNSSIAWGGMYWQYFEQLNKITSAESNLKMNKQLFLKKISDRGAELLPLNENNTLKVGDVLTVRMELRADRDYEYVHLKDMRAAGFEPTKALSGYRYQDGLWYYESIKDASTNFFITYLRKGTYVFEYELRVTHAGRFSNGITTFQCMYTPEFSAHSEGINVKVE